MNIAFCWQGWTRGRSGCPLTLLIRGSGIRWALWRNQIVHVLVNRSGPRLGSKGITEGIVQALAIIQPHALLKGAHRATKIAHHFGQIAAKEQ